MLSSSSSSSPLPATCCPTSSLSRTATGYTPPASDIISSNLLALIPRGQQRLLDPFPTFSSVGVFETKHQDIRTTNPRAPCRSVGYSTTNQPQSWAICHTMGQHMRWLSTQLLWRFRRRQRGLQCHPLVQCNSTMRTPSTTQSSHRHHGALHITELPTRAREATTLIPGRTCRRVKSFH